MKKGDKVVAKNKVSSGWTTIPAGTRGIVTEREGMFSGPTVAFEGYGEHSVSAKDLQKI